MVRKQFYLTKDQEIRLKRIRRASAVVVEALRGVREHHMSFFDA